MMIQRIHTKMLDKCNCIAIPERQGRQMQQCERCRQQQQQLAVKLQQQQQQQQHHIHYNSDSINGTNNSGNYNCCHGRYCCWRSYGQHDWRQQHLRAKSAGSVCKSKVRQQLKGNKFNNANKNCHQHCHIDKENILKYSHLYSYSRSLRGVHKTNTKINNNINNNNNKSSNSNCNHYCYCGDKRDKDNNKHKHKDDGVKGKHEEEEDEEEAEESAEEELRALPNKCTIYAATATTTTTTMATPYTTSLSAATKPKAVAGKSLAPAATTPASSTTKTTTATPPTNKINWFFSLLARFNKQKSSRCACNKQTKNENNNLKEQQSNNSANNRNNNRNKTNTSNKINYNDDNNNNNNNNKQINKNLSCCCCRGCSNSCNADCPSSSSESGSSNASGGGSVSERLFFSGNGNAMNYYNNNKFNKLLQITKYSMKLLFEIVLLLITWTMLMPAICQRLTSSPMAATAAASETMLPASALAATLKTTPASRSSKRCWRMCSHFGVLVSLLVAAVSSSSLLSMLPLLRRAVRASVLPSRGLAILSALGVITAAAVAKSQTTQFLTMPNKRGLSARPIKPAKPTATPAPTTRPAATTTTMITTILTLTLPCSMLLPSVMAGVVVASSNAAAGAGGGGLAAAAAQQAEQQQRQRQLFDLLTKNLLQQKNLEQDHHHLLPLSPYPAYQQEEEQSQQQQTFHQKQFKRNNNYHNSPNYYLHDDDGDDDENDESDGSDLNFDQRIPPNIKVNDSLETIGFVADDGDQRYEKVEKAAGASNRRHSSPEKAMTNIPVSSINCPRDCRCLNDYFDCTKRHLDRVPTLPNYVQTLDLSNNQLNDTSVLQIKNLPELTKLTLKRNQLNVVPKFIGLISLRQLNLANNRIQRISNESLAALPKLKFLNLSKNFLHTLEAEYFPHANRLAHLILNSNEIANIDEDAFKYVGSLLDLELDSNNLSQIPPGAFRFLNKLKKLSLNYNHLEIIWSTFKGLFAMQKLSLKSNNIRALQDGLFHIMRNIETIHLDHNHITSLSRQGLYNLSRLQHLSLSNNSITRIEVDTFEFTQSLVSLDLSSNNISEFKYQHLECLQRLRVLNLGHNKIEYLADNTFDCVKSLEDLNLRRNKLAWVIEDQNAAPIFKGLKKLKKLDLFGNNLKQISSKSLVGLNNLESLNLAGNHLASIHSNAFEHMKHLQKFIFKSTNFICDCELLWFQRWLNASAQTHIRQMQKNATICGYPEHLLDRDLMHLPPRELICADSPKPVITQEPSNQLAVKGANLTMKCVAISPAAASLAATDELKIKWRHDNQNLREREHHRGGGGGGSGGSSRNSGSAGSAGGGSSTTPINHSPLYQHNSHHHNHHHNHNHAGSYSYSTTDTQIDHDLSSNQTTIVGYLHLFNVSYESAGRYQCIVSNAFGTTYSQKFKISIGIHPKFLQIPSNLTIDSGDTARLVCSATGDPMPEIALKKFGGSDFPAATERRLQVIREENAFVITNAKTIDTGIYTCTAESPAGEIRVNASLVVNDKPQPPIPFTRKEIVVGETSVLECLSDMESELQQPHREWYKDNKPFHTAVATVPERFYFEQHKKLLVIMNSTSSDAGLWKCEIMDSSKTYALQTELVVVKPNLDENIKLILIVLVIILIATLIFYLICQCRERKLRLMMLNARVDDRNMKPLMSGRVSALDETQLTTLSRTYLRTQSERPRSLAGLEMMNGGLSLGSNNNASSLEPITPNEVDHNGRRLFPSSATTPTRYEQDIKCSRVGGMMPGGGHQHHNNGREHHTLDYIRRSSLYDPEQQHLQHHQQQDHLSSKDSGTGSDAAVKRSIDDFTEALLPPSTTTVTLASTPQKMQSLASTPAKQQELEMAYRRLSTGRASLARIDTFTDDDVDLEIEKYNTYNSRGHGHDGAEDDDELDRNNFSNMVSPVIGLSEYPDMVEMSEFSGSRAKEPLHSDSSHCGGSSSNNSSSHAPDRGESGDPDPDVADVNVDVDDADGVYCKLLKNCNNNNNSNNNNIKKNKGETAAKAMTNEKQYADSQGLHPQQQQQHHQHQQQQPRENLSLNLHLNSSRFSDHRRRPLYEPSDEDSPISASSLRSNALSTALTTAPTTPMKPKNDPSLSSPAEGKGPDASGSALDI